MFDNLTDRVRNRAGSSLAEILAVMSIVTILSGMAVRKIGNATDSAREARAIGDIKAIQADLHALQAEGRALPATLADIGRAGMEDPWGNAYVYIPFPSCGQDCYTIPGGARRDRFGVPLNSSFDLYSLGKDGQSAPSLTATASQDDLTRGSDGGFVGRGARY